MIGGRLGSSGPKRNDKDFAPKMCGGWLEGKSTAMNSEFMSMEIFFYVFGWFFFLHFFGCLHEYDKTACVFLPSLPFHGKLIQYILLNLCLFAKEKNRNIESDCNLEDKALHEIWCKEKPKKFVMLFACHIRVDSFICLLRIRAILLVFLSFSFNNTRRGWNDPWKKVVYQKTTDNKVHKDCHKYSDGRWKRNRKILMRIQINRWSGRLDGKGRKNGSRTC